MIVTNSPFSGGSLLKAHCKASQSAQSHEAVPFETLHTFRQIDIINSMKWTNELQINRLDYSESKLANERTINRRPLPMMRRIGSSRLVGGLKWFQSSSRGERFNVTDSKKSTSLCCIMRCCTFLQP